MKIRHPVTQRHPIIGLFSNDSFEKKIDILMSFRGKKTQFLSSNRFKPYLLRNRVCSNEFGRDYRVCQVCVRAIEFVRYVCEGVMSPWESHERTEEREF